MIARLHTKKTGAASWMIHWDGCSSSPIGEILEGPWQRATVYPTFTGQPMEQGEILGKFQVYDLRREKIIGHANTLKQCKQLFLMCL